MISWKTLLRPCSSTRRAGNRQQLIVTAVGKIKAPDKKVTRKTVFGGSARRKPPVHSRRKPPRPAQPASLTHIRNTVRGISESLLHTQHSSQAQAPPHRKPAARRKAALAPTKAGQLAQRVDLHPQRVWERLKGGHERRSSRRKIRAQFEELGHRLRLPSRRKKLPPRNAIDTTLAWGDIFMLTTTQIASTRIPLNQAGFLISILVTSWVGVAAVKGDYQHKQESGTFFGEQYQHMLSALASSASTWLMFVPTVLAVCTYLVAHQVLDGRAFSAPQASHDLPAEVEVLLAALWTLGCWRGTYAMLRPYM